MQNILGLRRVTFGRNYLATGQVVPLAISPVVETVVLWVGDDGQLLAGNGSPLLAGPGTSLEQLKLIAADGPNGPLAAIARKVDTTIPQPWGLHRLQVSGVEDLARYSGVQVPTNLMALLRAIRHLEVEDLGENEQPARLALYRQVPAAHAELQVWDVASHRLIPVAEVHDFPVCTFGGIGPDGHGCFQDTRKGDLGARARYSNWRCWLERAKTGRSEGLLLGWVNMTASPTVMKNVTLQEACIDRVLEDGPKLLRWTGELWDLDLGVTDRVQEIGEPRRELEAFAGPRTLTMT